MFKVSHKITGAKELRAKFKDLDNAVKSRHLETAANAGILPIQNEAIQLVAKDTGTLARSIHTETIKSSDTYVEVATGTDVEYALRIEFGFHDKDSLGRHYNQPAQPYMRPAYDNKRGEAVDETQDVLKELILKAAK